MSRCCLKKWHHRLAPCSVATNLWFVKKEKTQHLQRAIKWDLPVIHCSKQSFFIFYSEPTLDNSFQSSPMQTFTVYESNCSYCIWFQKGCQKLLLDRRNKWLDVKKNSQSTNKTYSASWPKKRNFLTGLLLSLYRWTHWLHGSWLLFTEFLPKSALLSGTARPPRYH